ncbi:hypothetical protein B0H16DRAFT_1883379 [Mycena metata]|uniref:Uncharacterized protein n=1 Tax=Mycena metata TaxID=1033252 RepID=A0AAD7JHT9_9AGAR|nr:hypothetical protein B0H16DRAFT_1883379 [Mycena metata]
MSRLTVAQKALAYEFAHSIFRWEVLIEEHGAVLRQNVNEYTIAYDAVERAVTPASYIVPPRDQWPEIIRTLNNTLEPKATTIVDRLTAVNACFFMAKLTMSMVAEDEKVCREMRNIRASLHDNHTYEKVEMRLPERNAMHPLLVERLGLAQAPPSPPPSRYPSVLPAEAFCSASVAHRTRAAISQQELKDYRTNPDPLLEMDPNPGLATGDWRAAGYKQPSTHSPKGKEIWEPTPMTVTQPLDASGADCPSSDRKKNPKKSAVTSNALDLFAQQDMSVRRSRSAITIKIDGGGASGLGSHDQRVQRVLDRGDGAGIPETCLLLIAYPG